MKNKVPGMNVPDELIKRMSGVPKEKQPEEGIKICVETIQRLKEMKGVRGFHIMAIEWEQKVPEIVESGRTLSAALCMSVTNSELPNRFPRERERRMADGETNKEENRWTIRNLSWWWMTTRIWWKPYP